MNKKRRSPEKQRYQPEMNALTEVSLWVSTALLILLLGAGINETVHTLYALKHMGIPPILEPGTGQITKSDGVLGIKPIVIKHLP